jgi:competence protein ComEC
MRAARLPRLLAIGVLAVVVLALAHRGEIRARAEAALDRGMPAREAALARGFVLGEDERIDPATVEDFRRSGLSHLLAVSGQNIALLALLAMPLLATLGMPLRVRLVWVLAAIAVYVPLAGGGPSIVRAGVMGGLSVLATLAGRRTSRLYGLGVAAILSLAIDPRIGSDVGWQLSFAAVLGILGLAGSLRGAIAARIGGRGWRGPLAEGAAMTVAATLSTAPLIAFHFGGISTTTLLANLLALPAVAPAMWLGMVVSIGGQVPGFPAAVPNALAALLLAYIAEVAAWCGRPQWAYLNVQLGSTGLLVSYLALAIAVVAIPALLRRRRLALLRQQRPRRSPQWRQPGWALSVVAIAAVASLWAFRGAMDGRAAKLPTGSLRVSVLDVGQGDAILLQPGAAPPVLVDAGPPGDGLPAKLRDAGVDSLGAAVLTHEEADHAGGLEELLRGLPVERLLYARLGRQLRQEVLAVHAGLHRIAAGDSFSSGRLRFQVLWPPAALLDDPLAGADPNSQALVLLARWSGFSMLLAADAEAGEVPIDPGPVDVLKVAHHGSEDAGLAALLDRSSPQVAVISVGEGNSYGHPAPSTLAQLAAHDVSTLRTDEAGTIVLDARKNSFVVAAGG